MAADPFSLAITIALNAASMAITASRTIEGPRLSDLSVSVADYGTPIPNFIGRVRIECQCFFAEPIREEKQESKGKGGKYKEYTYYGTWASLISDQRISAVESVYFDHHEIYNSVDGFNAFEEEGVTEDMMQIFYGTEDQTAPERMVAFVEDEEGVGTCPDYLGVAYLWFEDLPLGSLGNRYPQVSVIVDNAKQFDGWIYEFMFVNECDANSSDGLFNAPGTGGLYTWDNSVDWTVHPAYDSRRDTAGQGHRYWVRGKVAKPAGQWGVTFQNPNLSTPPGGYDVYVYGRHWWEDEYTLLFQNHYNGGGVISFNFPLEAISAEVGGGLVTSPALRDLMELLSGKVGMQESDYDYDELDQTILGYVWIQGPAKDIAAPALDIHDSDVRPSGFTIEGKKRGQPALGDALTYPWFVREGDDPLYSAKSIGDTDLPRRVVATFADMNAEYQPNSAVAQRNGDSVETKRELNIDLTTMSFEASDAQPLVERFLRRNWMGAVNVSMNLTPKELLLDPADVKDITLEDDLVIRGRLVRVTRQVNRVLRCTFEQDDARAAAGQDPDPSVNVLIPSPGAEAIGRPPPEQFKMVASEGFFIDAPMTQDSDDQTAPFLYLAAGPLSTEGTWPGANAYHSDTNVTYDAGFYSFLSANDNATWGNCLTTLTDALSTVIDEATVLYVNIYSGTLASVTQEQLDADPRLNQALIGSNANGWEIVQFRDVVLQSADGTQRQYALSGLYRGQRGTEQFTGTHGAGDRFLLVSSRVRKKDIGAGEIGDTDYYKMASAGFSVEDADVHTVDFAANAHRPYAPANILLHQDGDTLDWEIGWDRRSRIGGGNIDANDVPLGETAEQYRVRIMDGATVVRTISVTSASAVYTAAQQIADWGSEQGGISVEIVQVAPDLNLEGFAAAAEA